METGGYFLFVCLFLFFEANQKDSHVIQQSCNNCTQLLELHTCFVFLNVTHFNELGYLKLNYINSMSKIYFIKYTVLIILLLMFDKCRSLTTNVKM